MAFSGGWNGRDIEQGHRPVMIYRRLVGALTFYGANGFDGTEKRSRASGTNFPAVIAFNETARAQQPLAAGQRGDPTSRHFLDGARLPTEG